MARVAVSIPTTLHIFQNKMTQEQIDRLNSKYAGSIIPLKANGVEIGRVNNIRIGYDGNLNGTIFEIEEEYNRNHATPTAFSLGEL